MLRSRALRAVCLAAAFVGPACGLVHRRRDAPAPRPLDLNTASRRAIEKLPGITPSMARRVGEGRPYEEPAVHELAHVAVADYVPFIILIATLFTIGGGIYVRGSLRGSPVTNCVLIAIGTVLASWVGTTGAAMLMIRPLLRANRARRHRA